MTSSAPLHSNASLIRGGCLPLTLSRLRHWAERGLCCHLERKKPTSRVETSKCSRFYRTEWCLEVRASSNHCFVGRNGSRWCYTLIRVSRIQDLPTCCWFLAIIGLNCKWVLIQDTRKTCNCKLTDYTLM